MNDEPEQERQAGEGSDRVVVVGRIMASGHRDDGTCAPLIMMILSDGSWSLYADGVRIPVRISGGAMHAAAQEILDYVEHTGA